jgi:hypothetical protein
VIHPFLGRYLGLEEIDEGEWELSNVNSWTPDYFDRRWFRDTNQMKPV